MREAFGGSLDEVACAGQRHIFMEHVSVASRWHNPKRGRQPEACAPKHSLHELPQCRPSFASGGPPAPVEYLCLHRE
jgi:hypothetical protein